LHLANPSEKNHALFSRHRGNTYFWGRGGNKRPLNAPPLYILLGEGG
jgi:hypothetical protein